MMKKITVKLKTNPYDIYIAEDALKNLGALIKKFNVGSDAIVITTPAIEKLHANKLKKILKICCKSVKTILIPDSEKSKDAKLALNIIEGITAFDKNKKLFLVAFGGGVVGDLTGFIAAIYKRGIPYIQIPTTLLAQIDSSIGGKTAVDTAFGKNLIGAFYQPRFVLSDISLLKTLPKKQIISGLAEAVKYAAIKDAKFFSFIENKYAQLIKYSTKELFKLICRCSEIKALIVAKDEFDKKKIRIILNFGHTFGHAIETASNFKINHGEAVSIGMCYACKLSVLLKYMKKEDTDRITNLLKNIGLPTQILKINTKQIIKIMSHDKKFSEGKNRFVLLERIGKTKIAENITRDLIQKTLR